MPFNRDVTRIPGSVLGTGFSSICEGDRHLNCSKLGPRGASDQSNSVRLLFVVCPFFFWTHFRDPQYRYECNFTKNTLKKEGLERYAGGKVTKTGSVAGTICYITLLRSLALSSSCACGAPSISTKQGALQVPMEYLRRHLPPR